MSHHPYPDAGRALRQVARHDDELAPRVEAQAAETFVKWPDPPEGWGEAASARVQEVFGPFLDALRARPVAVPQLVFRPGRMAR